MNTRIQTQGFPVTRAIDSWTRDQIDKNLGRYDADVVAVDVFLTDINGPRGGQDKQVMVRILIKHRAPVLIETTGDDLYAAIDLSARRARRAVSRTLGRRRLALRRGLRSSRQLRMVQAASGDL